MTWACRKDRPGDYVLRILLQLLLGMCLTLVLAACETDARPVSAATAAASAQATTPSEYVLASGDRVRVTVYGEDRLSGEFAVTTTGQISFPLIGNLTVAGLTLADTQKLIHDHLADGYLKDPRVTAEFTTYRPYYVLGEIARPGQFPYVDGLTLRQAIAAAGGFTYRAKRGQIYVMAPGAAQEVAIDLTKEPNRLVKPGETIRIGERFF